LPEGYSATAKAIAIAQGAADPDFVKLPGTATKVSSNR
jgi:hypothetical protein